MFTFKGPIESSKSWMNRALVIQYYNPNLIIDGFSKAQDVIHLQQAISDLSQGQQEFDLAEGGTTFRFFALLCSRIPGEWKLKASRRLLERPQADLLDILKQLQVNVKIGPEQWIITSEGWNLKNSIQGRGNISSQFISGLLLNSWNLNRDLQIVIPKPLVSEEYLLMTIKLLEKSGLLVEKTNAESTLNLIVKKNQLPTATSLTSELDVSCAFSLSAAAAINGSMQITNWNSETTQPDSAFIKIFQNMNIKFLQNDCTLSINQQSDWQAIEVNLQNEPDLFPVLAVLCALARGTSFLYGAKQLKAKESDRLAKTHELLSLCGVRNRYEKDGLRIEGQSFTTMQKKVIWFDPDQDHRMAMAAGLMKLAGYNLQIKNPEVVQKSYPDFWNHIQVLP